MIAVGWQTRIAAVALAGFCILAAVLFHGNISDRSHLLHLEKDLAIAGGLLVLAVAGPGRFALERDLRTRPSRAGDARSVHADTARIRLTEGAIFLPAGGLTTGRLLGEVGP